jgi:tricorn protease-like protein
LGAVTALAYSPDGKRLALGTYGEVVLYDTATWQMAGQYKRVEDGVRALAFAPDGKTLAIGCGLPGRDGETLIWNMDPASAPQRYAGEKDTVEAVAFRGDGKAVLCASNDNTALYYPQWPSAGSKKLDEHNGRVTAVAFSPRTDFVFLTGGMDRIVKVWDPKTVKTVVNFDQSEGGICGLAFLPNGEQFVGGSLDGKLYWWGISVDKEKGSFSGYLYRVEMAHEGGVAALTRSGDGNRFITCGADSQVAVWNIGGGRIRTFKEATQPCYAVALSPDGKIAAAGGRDGLLYLWEVDTGKPLPTVTPPALPLPPAPAASRPKPAANASGTAKHPLKNKG